MRKSIHLFSQVFPIEPGIWYQYLSFEVENVKSVEDVNWLIQLFKRAFEDYYCIDIALLLAYWTSNTNRFNDKQAEAVWSMILPAFGYEFSKGQLIWEAWRDDVVKRQPETEEKYNEIFEKIMQELRIPLANMQDKYEESLNFIDAHYRMFPNFDRNETDEVFFTSLQTMQEVIPFEEKLSQLMEHQEQYETYENYITNCFNSLSDKGIQVLHERMVESCHQNVHSWETYLKYISERPEFWTPNVPETSLVFHQTIEDIITRAMRHNQTPPILTEILLMKMNLIETNFPLAEAKKRFHKIVEEVCTVGFGSKLHMVTICKAYCTFLARKTIFNYEDEATYFREMSNSLWKMLCNRYCGSNYDENRMLRFWEDVQI